LFHHVLSVFHRLISAETASRQSAALRPWVAGMAGRSRSTLCSGGRASATASAWQRGRGSPSKKRCARHSAAEKRAGAAPAPDGSRAVPRESHFALGEAAPGPPAAAPDAIVLIDEGLEASRVDCSHMASTRCAEPFPRVALLPRGADAAPFAPPPSRLPRKRTGSSTPCATCTKRWPSPSRSSSPTRGARSTG
jgi:hypothetical protein